MGSKSMKAMGGGKAPSGGGKGRKTGKARA